MQYQSHGKFTIWRHKNILLAELIGSWNEQSALQFEAAFKKIAITMPKPWAHIVYLNDWELCVPEMYSIIERLVAWCIDNGLVKAANIYATSAIKSEILNKMIVSKQGDFERAVFDSERDAKLWLDDAGFAIPEEATIRYLKASY
ncbi:hypothetical protein CW745_00120 [Psychromonas sp. psych-6C06]|uniref:hypothetical protein n=1 Tax=Psychromonas sp. psych-6C06 TaxID=2058089 RepID=UPI000C34C70E|nr:hypothetical protein [Psychromonas sp. psych-6C06]PKF63298.1 hypothetical protein CW745_00120 [Psychromonas sp. psych-6C06]